MHIAADCMSGHIGPIWWVNGSHSPSILTGLYGLTSDLSRHLVWREGGWGFRIPGTACAAVRQPRWHLLQALN